ncbi:short chain dehydrogenase [Blastomyces gilchristii SLH14081]|uniref:Short chain dehydrogenase n=1 Tax=Blastomyces gilchristii (strain SLH14081) TaxID=559298 RepID=A0A179UQ26_BLAGS|nr:short chain dehydrogenase [Blastomyces gilchristii SLH14081]OAT09131.1 short chain dehydrogenase [Blastomyces gilchristii SLH14081]
MNLILVDIHADNLTHAHSILGDTPTAKTLTHIMDVSWLPGNICRGKSERCANFKPKVPGMPWEDSEYFQKTFSTTFMGVVNVLSVFLPVVTASADEPRAIIITGSKQGITNPPGGKIQHTTQNVSTHLLIPGWTYTSMAGSSGVLPDTQKPKGAWLPEQVARYMYDKMGKGEFYIICLDDEVSESLDRARMAWAMEDVMERRPPLSRWNDMWKDVAAEWIEKDSALRKKA